MRDHRPTSTDDLIAASSLKQVQDHAKEIVEINQLLATFLPPTSAEYCRAANVRSGYLVIEVASAALKMKINYDRLTILNHLRSNGFARLTGIDLKINPELYRTNQEKQTFKRKPLSESAANSILATASVAPEKIKNRLERIAELAKKGD